MQKRFSWNIIVNSHRACHDFLTSSLSSFLLRPTFTTDFQISLLAPGGDFSYNKDLEMLKKRNFYFPKRGYTTFRILFLTQHLLMFHYYKGRDPLAHTSTSTSFCRSSGKKKQTKALIINYKVKQRKLQIYIHLFQGNNRLLYKIHTLKPLW